MPRIDLRVICHRLGIDPKVRPVTQKKRKLESKKYKTIMQETKKLLRVGFVKEVHFTTWLESIIMVPKSSRMKDMCRFHKLEQSFPEECIPSAKHRQTS